LKLKILEKEVNNHELELLLVVAAVDDEFEGISPSRQREKEKKTSTTNSTGASC